MIEFFDSIYQFLTVGIYDLLVEFTSYILINLTISLIELKIFLLQFSWDIAKEILSTFDLSSKIQEGLDTVPTAERQLIYFFRLPEVISNLMAGLVGRFVFRFIS